VISKELDLHGAWFFQVKEDKESKLKILEIAPRIGGTMATHRVLGINFPLLSIYENIGVEFEIMLNQCDVEIDRALINRYKHNLQYHNVYVDLDDTLIVNDRLNTDLVKFLYQSINNNCRIILITKHVGRIENILGRWRINNLFDEIILLKKDESKAKFISSKDSILIDDSFSERKSVYDTLKIPTFDCSMLELLFDERI